MVELSERFEGTLDAKDKEIKELREQYNRRYSVHEGQQRNCTILRQHAGAEVRELREKLMTAEREWNRCRDDLFRLQPVCQTSDGSIIGAFESLSEQLMNWIDNETFTFQKAGPHAHVECHFFGSKDSDAANFLQMYPGAGEYICRHKVNLVLSEHMFGPNIATGNQHMLQTIKQGMAALKPPRGMKVPTWTFSLLCRV